MSLLSESLRIKLIPWSQQNASERFIVTRTKMSPAEMPDGAVVKRRKIVGQRVVVKERRDYGNARSRIARWPEAGMDEWEHYKMVCVLAGSIDFHVGHYGVQCGEGFYLLIPPGIPQTSAPYHASGSFCDVLNIILHPSAVQCFVSHSQPELKRVESLENYLFKGRGLTEMFRMMMEEVFDGRKNARCIANNLLAAFFAALQREVEEGNYVNPGPIGRPETLSLKSENAPDFKTELLHYVQTHLNENLTLEKVSHGMYLSRAQFVRRIRQETGKTFVQFLTDYRLEEAKVLLRDSEWTISAIAGFLGFRSNNYFQTVFRNASGKTPGQYRIDVRK